MKLQRLKKRVRQELSEWITAQGRASEWDKVVLHFKCDPMFNAEVTRTPSGSYRIFLNETVPLRLANYLGSFLADPEFWQISWRRRANDGHRKRSFDLTKTMPSDLRRMSSESNSGWLTAYLAEQAVRFLFYHEMAHIIRGHLFYAHLAFGDSRRCFSMAEARPSPVIGAELNFCRVAEIDADIVGADHFIRVTALDYWKKVPPDTKQAFAVLLLFSVGLVFLALDTVKSQRASDGIHQSPLIRFLIVVDVIGSALASEIGLRGRRLNLSAIAAFRYLMKAADLLESNSSWKGRSKQVFANAMRERAKVLAAYHRNMGRLFEGHSTLLPVKSREFIAPKIVRLSNI